MRTPRLGRLCYVLAVALGALPLWACRQIPMVDLPQHLLLISALHRISDPTTLYPATFALRGELTPYLGYYHLVSLINWALPLELANRVFLTAVVVGLPLSVGALLRSLERPRWASVLCIPFAYGDSFGWGFVNFCAAVPLAFCACAAFVRCVRNPERRLFWAVVSGALLVLVLLFHIQGFGFLALGLPWLLCTTSAGSTSRGWIRSRVPALLSVIPGVLLFAVWGVGRLTERTEVQAGAPWKAWGPLLSPQNLAFKSTAQNLSELSPVLANLLRDGSDRCGFDAVVLVAVAAAGLGLLGGRGQLREPGIARWRLLGLAAIAFALYFVLPFDIRGAVYYLNTRYAHVAAPLLVAAVPPLAARWRPIGLALGTAAALLLAVPLARAFAAFDVEAAPLLAFAERTPPRQRVMGLVFDPASRVLTHPVFLHAAAVPARLTGGITNFSFALTPHSPLRYRGTPPPTFPSEWRPEGFRWDTMGPAYDHFLVRGIPPERVFGPRLGNEVKVVASGERMWWLERRFSP